ncbi:MAG: DUF3276 family protein [Bacteroidetes bacterium]|nr:DUF3276 family protein [Bacteroidota bacterium]
MEMNDPKNQPLHTVKIRAGRRSYFFDVRATKAENDFYVVITENKKMEGKISRSKIFVYKEDFKNFLESFNQSVSFAENKLKELGVTYSNRSQDQEHHD